MPNVQCSRRHLLVMTVAGYFSGIALVPTSAAELSAREQLLRSLEPRLKSAIYGSAPGAAFTYEGDVLVLRYRTRQYLTHPRFKNGETAREAVRQEGPEPDGLLMTVQVVLPEHMAAELPQTFHEEHWTRRAELYAFPTGEMLLVNIAFGKRTDPSLLRRVRKTLPKEPVPDMRLRVRKLRW